MNVNQLMTELKKVQRQGRGKVEVHVSAHDNSVGESQGVVWRVSYFEKGGAYDDPAGRDEALYKMSPGKMICLHT